MSNFETEDFPSVSKSFDDHLKKWEDIENSELPLNSEELQSQIETSIKALEDITVSISYLGIFSTNEAMEEISTQSIKFMLLPVLLGSLTLKTLKKERDDILKIASAYFKDFLKRCNDYHLITYTESSEDDIQENVTNSRPTPEDLRKMGLQREEKIQRYRKKKALCDKLAELKKAIENPSQDEEVVREYYMTLINHFIYQSLDEIDSVTMELQMLQKMKAVKPQKNLGRAKDDQVKPLRPFLITRNDVEKKVFGAGYPSLPVLTVEEFYEQRVKEGWFPPRNETLASCSKKDHSHHQASKAEEDEDEEDDKDLEKLRQRDEWRDTHRTGWGNTYNRS